MKDTDQNVSKLAKDYDTDELNYDPTEVVGMKFPKETRDFFVNI
jgi:hypothetical protein